MSSPYIGEIRMFAGNFPPSGWAHCQGQLVPISENETLFNLIGTTFGGDGQETFALPDLQGRLPVHQGQGQGLSQNYTIGETFGVESITLTTQQIPNHTHAALASSELADTSDGTNRVLAKVSKNQWVAAPSTQVAMRNSALMVAGGSQPHDNTMPFLVVGFIISLFGIFPSQA